MSESDDWIRSMGGNPARYRNLVVPPIRTEHPEDEVIDARCPRKRIPRRQRPRDSLQARSTGAAPFGGGQPERADPVHCTGTRAKVIVRQSGRIRALTLACTTCGHTWRLAY